MKLFDDDRSPQERAEAVANFRRVLRRIAWALLVFPAFPIALTFVDGEWTRGRAVVIGVTLAAALVGLATTHAPWQSERPDAAPSRGLSLALGAVIGSIGIAVPVLALTYDDFFDARYALPAILLWPVMIAIGVGAVRRGIRPRAERREQT